MSKQARSEHGIPALDELRDEFARVAAADARRPRSRGVRPLVAALAVLTFAVTATAVAIRVGLGDPPGGPGASSPRERPTAASEGEGPASTPPPPAGFAAHGLVYETLGELVAASDLILIGTVEETRVGEVYGEGPEDEFPTRILHTTLAVEEVLRGSGSGGSVVVATDELAFRGPGIEDWREPRRRVLLFLTRSPENPDRYVLANLAYFQTAYFIVRQEIEMTVGGDVTGLSERIAEMTMPEIEEKVRAVRP